MSEAPRVIQAGAHVLAHRESWTYRGEQRPEFADPVEAEQRSVWDFPRPPAMAPIAATVRVTAGAHEVARSNRALEVMETASAPTVYLPPDQVQESWLQPNQMQSHCEWKGLAQELQASAAAPPGVPRGVALGWRYIAVYPEFAQLQGWYAFYPQKLSCYVGAERAMPQAGGYYGGWVLSDLAGPIKGAPGSEGW